MKILISFIATVCLALSAEARLGDTQAKVTERYGKPVEVYRDVKGRTGYIYRSDGYRIVVEYINDISQSEVYVKENDAEFTESELNTILSANAQNEKWEEWKKPTKPVNGSTYRSWVIRRTLTLSAYGPCIINGKQFQHAHSVGTRAYNEQNNALDKR